MPKVVPDRDEAKHASGMTRSRARRGGRTVPVAFELRAGCKRCVVPAASVSPDLHDEKTLSPRNVALGFLLIDSTCEELERSDAAGRSFSLESANNEGIIKQ